MSSNPYSHNFEKSEEDLPPRKIYSFTDYPQTDSLLPFHPENSHYAQNVPIAVDLGRTFVRIGMAGTQDPFLNFPTLSARYRDRKTNRPSTFVGYDVFYESTIKANMRNPYDGQMLTNWEAVEKIFDFSLLHMGVDSEHKVNNPFVINETLATPLSQRQNLSQLLFETYNVPSAAFGVDSLFSYYQNNGKSGMVVGTNHEATHIIPVLNSRPIIDISKRINVGGHQLYDFMKCSIGLKYPYFPTRLNDWQIQSLVQDHCYVSKDFNNEIRHSLDLDYLEKNDITIEAPFNEIIKEEKTEEQLKQEEQKRKENIKKLQDQAKVKRLEKLQLKQKDFEYYTKMKESFNTMTKREVIDTIREAGFDDEADLNKYLGNLEKSLKKAKLLDTSNDNEDESGDDETKYDFSLLDRPSAELTPDELKEKRRLRLIKSNIDSKLRAKKEKEEAIREAEEIRQRDIEFRNNDLENWIKQKRQLLDNVVKRRKERLKLKDELGDRKSRASQQRMRNIASLADDGPAGNGSGQNGSGGNNKRRHNVTIDNDPNDTFGANDDDWAIYRDIAGVDDEELSAEELEEIYLLEKQLLEFDPNFTMDDTQERQFNYRNSTIHKFLRGPRDFDNEDQHQLHQIHLNVERIRIPEIMFQPSITGIDQAGVAEVVEDTLLRRLPQELGFSGDISTCEPIKNVFNDIFLTGGCTLFHNFHERMEREVRMFSPTNVSFNVRVANDPILDAWRGMSKWAYNEYKVNNSKGFWTRQQYDECGIHYMTDNGFGCINLT